MVRWHRARSVRELLPPEGHGGGGALFCLHDILPDGRRYLLARTVCRSDALAMDRMPASIWSGARVFEGSRLLGILPGTRR